MLKVKELPPALPECDETIYIGDVGSTYIQALQGVLTFNGDLGNAVYPHGYLTFDGDLVTGLILGETDAGLITFIGDVAYLPHLVRSGILTFNGGLVAAKAPYQIPHKEGLLTFNGNLATDHHEPILWGVELFGFFGSPTEFNTELVGTLETNYIPAPRFSGDGTLTFNGDLATAVYAIVAHPEYDGTLAFTGDVATIHKVPTPQAVGGTLTFNGDHAWGWRYDQVAQGALTFGGALISAYRIGQTADGTLVFSGTLNQALGAARGGVLSLVGSLQAGLSASLGGVLSFGGEVLRQRIREIEGALTFDGAFEREYQIGRAFSGPVPLAGQLAKLIQVDDAGTMNIGRAIEILPQKALQGTADFSGDLEAVLITIPEVFWILYSGNDLMTFGVADGSGASTNRPDWETFANANGYNAEKVFGVPHDANKVNVGYADGGNDGMAYSDDRSSSWTSTLNIAEALKKVRFDRSTGDGWIPIHPTFDAAYVSAIKAQFSPSTGSYDPATVHTNYSEWYEDGGEVIVYETNDDGATWSPVSLGYLGQDLPARMYINGPVANINWWDYGTGDGYCASSIGLICGEDCADVPSIEAALGCGVGGDIMACSAPPHYYMVKSRETSPGAGDFDVDEYYICDASYASDPNNLTVYKPVVDDIHVAPRHDGTYYLIVSAHYGTEESNRVANNATTTPFDDEAPDTADYVTLIYHVTGSTLPSPVVIPYATMTEDSFHSVFVDPTDADTLIFLGTGWDLWRLKVSTESVTDITPSAVIMEAESLVITSQGTIVAPLKIYDAGADENQLVMFRSTDQGDSWSQIDVTSFTNNFFSDKLLMALSTDEDVQSEVLAMMLYEGKAVFSNDDGQTWYLTSIVGQVDATVESISAY